MAKRLLSYALSQDWTHAGLALCLQDLGDFHLGDNADAVWSALADDFRTFLPQSDGLDQSIQQFAL